jgi:signal transduction histidine kinase
MDAVGSGTNGRAAGTNRSPLAAPSNDRYRAQVQESASRRRRLALWAAAALWWTSSGLVSALNFHQWALDNDAPVSWRHACTTQLAGAWLWVPITVAVFWLARRFPLERERWRRSLAVLATGGIAVVVLRALLVATLDPWVGWYESPPEPWPLLLTSLNNNLFLYWMFIGVAHALHYAERTREREVETSRLAAQLAEARLGALHAQLHPHFLFNTLQSIAELVHDQPDAADQMIVQLSALLRRSLDSATTHTAPLRDELDLLEPYLAIEQVRFGDRLRVRWDIAPDALAAAVPRLILQPLVENSLRHGLAPRAAAGNLVIAASIDGDRLVLEVRDDGVGCAAAEPAARTGVGLANTRDRLRQFYGADHAFTLTTAPGGGSVARIEVPVAAASAAA